MVGLDVELQGTINEGPSDLSRRKRASAFCLGASYELKTSGNHS